MKKIFLAAFLTLSLVGCKSSKVGSTANLQLRYLDDHVIAEDLIAGKTLVGGLSGIDFHDGNFYVVSDQPGNPRFYTAKIHITGEKIDSISFMDVTRISTRNENLKDEHLDLEGILFDPEKQEFILSSEGAIKNKKDPMVLKVSKDGEFKGAFDIPENFLAESDKKPRDNGTFEGLARAYDKKGVWVAMELPLKTDGPKPKLVKTKSPVRITYFDTKTGKATRQFPYRLEPIAKIPWLYFAVNGVTDLLEYAPDKFLILERGYASGHGSKGNTVRIFDVDASLGTNTLDRNNLGVTFYNPAKKKLVFDFKWVKKHLTEEIIDNIEGITFGPLLPNGNRSIVLISDNNFNSLGRQLNQVILMEFTPKK
ncbi:MAG TPA: esterase-like activity of phytase family protein [Salinimicrobium catena]|mgnify:CR=1 FL=1|uniref:Esterase-like activity of phytase family protein n=1 Tax=Salinimicrobium catena TaxID=390640 RepID=A0A7C2M521_9FLAO|nr:esterase-like activity of phytase family protein [Salinimicrobium catena]